MGKKDVALKSVILVIQTESLDLQRKCVCVQGKKAVCVCGEAESSSSLYVVVVVWLGENTEVIYRRGADAA